MADHPNIGMIQQSYPALASGDVEFLKSRSAPEFTFEVSGTSAVSGTSHGVEEAAVEFGRSMELTDGRVSRIREWIWDQAADVAFWA